MRPLLLALLFAAPVLAAPAHQHGVAALDVAVEPSRVTLDLDTPLDNLLGFERAPRTDAERERAAAVVKKLNAAEGLFRIDSAAGCTLAKVTLVSAPLGLGTAVVDKEGHADLQGRFEFTCKAGSKAGFVEVGLFDAFSSLKRIDLQVVTPRGQLKATLVKPASRVALAR
jgi:Protein of unknown function (DUF2796)